MMPSQTTPYYPHDHPTLPTPASEPMRSIAGALLSARSDGGMGAHARPATETAATSGHPQRAQEMARPIRKSLTLHSGE